MTAERGSPPSQACSADELKRLSARLDAEIAMRQGMERRLAALMTAYARFVPPQLIELLGKESVLDVDWGNQVEKKMTILFADIRDFATLSERLSPQQCFDFINAFLSWMEPVVLDHGGFIDKYIGDSVMALFPSRGDDALQAALGMLEELERFNASRASGNSALPGRQTDQPIRIGIGLNSGLLMLGVVGGNKRMEITVISDAVNLAARVETLTKTWQTPVLLTQHTLNSIRAPAAFSIRFIDRVRVRGKHLAQSIYEAFDADPAPLKAAKLKSLELFEDALAHYHFRRRDEAQRLFAACLEHHPDDKPAAVYWQRCRHFDPEQAADAFESDGLAVWQPEYLLGFHAFDEMHRLIFDDIVATAEALYAEDIAGAEQNIRRLIELTAEHFAIEETLMDAHGYPASPRAEHKQQHLKFSAFLATLREDISAGRISPLRLAFRCQFLLLDWFISHISITDRHLERYLA